MERVPAAQANVRGLADLLAPVATPEGPRRVDTPPEVDPAIDLQHQRQQILEEAKRDGYAAGLAEAEGKLRKAKEQALDELRRTHAAEGERLADANRRLGELLGSITAAADGMAQEAASCVAEISYMAVVRFLGEMERGGELFRRVCQQALEEYQQRPVVLKVAPADAEVVEALASGREVSIEIDSRLRSGQCRLLARQGEYDTSIEARLESLKQAFLRSLETPETGK